MSQNREQHPAPDRFDIIEASETRLIILDPVRLKECVDEPPINGINLVDANKESLPEPITRGYVHYSADRETNTLWLGGRIDFIPPENTEGSQHWQDELLETIDEDLQNDGIAISYLPQHRSTLYAHVDDENKVKITIEENTKGCALKLEVEQSEPDNQANKSAKKDFLPIVKTFLAQWNASLSNVASLYGEDVEQGPKDITVQLPKLRTSTQRSLVSSIPKAEQLSSTQRNALSFQDIGGATEAKAFLELTALSFKHPEIAREYDIHASSFLLHGPAGTGKTSLVHAFAHEIGAELREYSSTDIVDMYVGNSGKYIENVFEAAKTVESPLVLFFDEFDSIAPKGSAGTAERQQVKNILKKQLIDLKEHPNIVVAAATNLDLGDFDEALIRAGRLTPKYVAIPTATERVDVWACVLWRQVRKLDTVPDNFETTRRDDIKIPDTFHLYTNEVSPAALASKSDGFTGADMEEVLQRVQKRKFLERIQHGAITSITQADILEEIRSYQKP